MYFTNAQHRIKYSSSVAVCILYDAMQFKNNWAKTEDKVEGDQSCTQSCRATNIYVA